MEGGDLEEGEITAAERPAVEEGESRPKTSAADRISPESVRRTGAATPVRAAGCVLSQLSNFASSTNAVLVSFAQRALHLRYHPQRHPDRRGGAVCDRNSPKSPKGAPEQAGPRTRTTARHWRVTKTEPTSTRAVHPARNRPETAPDERGTSNSLKALINAVAEIPTVSSLHRWRPAQEHHERDPRAGLRAAQARFPHRPRSARVATQWRLSYLEQRGCPTISWRTLDGKSPWLADDEAWLGMTHLVLTLVPHQANRRFSSGVCTTRKRVCTPAFRCTTRVLGPWVGRCVFIEGEFTPIMPPLTRLARFRARARRCARSAPEKRPNRGKWTSKMNPECAICPRTTLTRGQ